VTFGQLRTWLEVARRGSVKAAAEALSVRASSVSSAIAVLERELGVDLIARVGRRIRLTPAGEELARFADHVLGLADKVGQAIQDAAAQTTRVRMVAVEAAAESILPAILKRFRQSEPHAQFSLSVGNLATVFERLLSREADLGIGGRPHPELGIEGELFFDNHLVVVGAPGHRLATLAAIEPGQLTGETWLIREPGSGTRRTTDVFLTENGIQPAAVITLGSNAVVRQAVAAGLGVTLISTHSTGPALAGGSLARLNVAGTPLHRPWYVLYVSGEREGASRALLELLRSLGIRGQVEQRVNGFAPHPRPSPEATARSRSRDLENSIAVLGRRAPGSPPGRMRTWLI
jgi:DNA-binding transcriptional LysR family regulator